MTRPQGPLPTLGQLQESTSRIWVYCDRCQHSAPIKFGPLIARWSADASSCARCTVCDHKGATLQHPGWVDSVVGFQAFPISKGGTPSFLGWRICLRGVIPAAGRGASAGLALDRHQALERATPDANFASGNFAFSMNRAGSLVRGSASNRSRPPRRSATAINSTMASSRSTSRPVRPERDAASERSRAS
jgi:hypothetical protein